MKQTFMGPLPDHARNLLRRAGYSEQRTRSGQISYIRRVSGERFPRYHAYVEDVVGGGMQVNLHVDQKEASYEGTHAHAGEYEGSLVEQEMERVARFVHSLQTTTSQQTTETPKKKSSFVSKFFS